MPFGSYFTATGDAHSKWQPICVKVEAHVMENWTALPCGEVLAALVVPCNDILAALEQAPEADLKKGTTGGRRQGSAGRGIGRHHTRLSASIVG